MDAGFDDGHDRKSAETLARWALCFAAFPLLFSTIMGLLPATETTGLVAGFLILIVSAASTISAVACAVGSLRTYTPPRPLALVALGSSGTLVALTLLFVLSNSVPLFSL